MLEEAADEFEGKYQGQSTKIDALRNLSVERHICEQVLFNELAEKDIKHLSEETVYNDLIE